MARSVKSYAKINLSLSVVSKRSDGYHELDGIMLPIELHDSLIISVLRNRDNFVTVDDFSNGLVHYNLATTAINALADHCGFSERFRVFIHKVIPMQAGLGGGSSNAAFTLKTINSMLKLNLSDEELIKIASPLGADIPFFINCKPARCQGIGEKFTNVEVKNNYYAIIVKPKAGCSTKEVFAIADKSPYKQIDIDKVQDALANGDDDALASLVGNSLEEAAISLVPEIQIIKDKLKELGLKIVLMTGSGSAVFGLSTDLGLLKKVRKVLEDEYFAEIAKVLKK